MQPLPRLRRFKAPTPHVPAIPTYHALSFMDVGAAVDFCNRLVPFVVPRCGGLPENESPAVVWFHVPERSQRSTTDGCVLFLSAGALCAAKRVGLACTVVGEIPRDQLPDTSVLVFGEDAPPPRSPAVHAEPRVRTRRSVASTRAEAAEDAVLR